MDADGLNLIIAHGSDDIRQSIGDELNDRHSVITCAGTIVDLKKAVSDRWPDLIVAGITFPDGDGLDALIEIGKDTPIPTVIVTSRRSLALVEKAMRDHVMAYLIEPVTKEDLEAAIIVAWSRYQELEELQDQVSDLRSALEHRKVIERAKGILMAADEITEGEAFSHLRKKAQDKRTLMVDIANEILEEYTQQEKST